MNESVCMCVCVCPCDLWILFCMDTILYNWFTNEDKLNKKEVLVGQ